MGLTIELLSSEQAIRLNTTETAIAGSLKILIKHTPFCNNIDSIIQNRPTATEIPLKPPQQTKRRAA
jgi:hypothetical protein